MHTYMHTYIYIHINTYIHKCKYTNVHTYLRIEHWCKQSFTVTSINIWDLDTKKWTSNKACKNWHCRHYQDSAHMHVRMIYIGWLDGWNPKHVPLNGEPLDNDPKNSSGPSQRRLFSTPRIESPSWQSGGKTCPLENQGCQMVYFQTKAPNLGNFLRTLECKRLVDFMAIWNILRTFGIFYGH
jgi:hypothetical protein